MPSQYEKDYCSLIQTILRDGDNRNTRNHPTRSIFGAVLTVHELSWGQFPILQGRRLYPKGVFGELAAFLKGPKTVRDFEREGCNYWKDWADENGNLNVDYGNAWIDFNGVNQLEMLLNSLREDPNGRRHIISGWRPDHLHKLSLPCCHLLYQWYVRGTFLEMIWYQRSVDTMIGLPSDVILAAAMNIIIAEYLGLTPGKLVFMLGDTHIYNSHMEHVYRYMDAAMSSSDAHVGYLCSGTPYSFHSESIELIGYDPAEPINFEIHP